jgi:hypothetical protein
LNIIPRISSLSTIYWMYVNLKEFSGIDLIRKDNDHEIIILCLDTCTKTIKNVSWYNSKLKIPKFDSLNFSVFNVIHNTLELVLLSFLFLVFKKKKIFERSCFTLNQCNFTFGACFRTYFGDDVIGTRKR